MNERQQEIITLTCEYCGDTWQQLPPQRYTCCMKCWRKMFHGDPNLGRDPDYDPCRITDEETDQ